MVVSENKDTAMVGYYKVLAKPNDKYQRIKLTGLDPDKLYQINGSEISYDGDELMNVGIILNENYANIKKGIDMQKHPNDYYSEVFIIKSL